MEKYQILIGLFMLILSSCNDYDEGVKSIDPEEPTIQFTESTIIVDRNDSIVSIPFEISSNNRYLKWFMAHIVGYNCASPDLAVSYEDEVTSYSEHVYLMHGEDSGVVKFYINPCVFTVWDYSYRVTLDLADGVKIGRRRNCTILVRTKEATVVDNIYRNEGCTFTYVDRHGQQHSVLTKANPIDLNLWNTVLLHGPFLFDRNYVITIGCNKGENGKIVGLTLKGGDVLSWSHDFGMVTLPNGEQTIINDGVLVTGFLTASGEYTTDGGLKGTWNDDLSEVTFDGTLCLFIRGNANRDNKLLAIYDEWSDIKIQIP